MFPTIQDFKNNEDIKFAIHRLEIDLEVMVQNRDNGHWLSPQLEQIYKEIQLMKWAIEKIKNEWDII